MNNVHVRTITVPCVVGFENNLVQMLIMIKQCAMNKNMSLDQMSNFVHRFQ